MKHIAITFSNKNGLSIFETVMRTEKELAEYREHLAYPYAWEKIVVEDSGVIVAEWTEHNV